MSQPTFGEIINDARDYLGDERAGTFKNPYLKRWACRALDEMVSVFGAYQLEQVMVISIPITVVAAATELDPAATTGLENFGEPSIVEERPALSGQKYTIVKKVDLLPQREASDKLIEYTLNQGKLQFVGATGNIEVRLHYYASGNAEALDEETAIAVDDCRNFLAAATAAKAGPGKGYTEEAKLAAAAAYGPNNPNPLASLGGFLEVLVNKRLRVQQQSPVIPRMYRAGEWRR